MRRAGIHIHVIHPNVHLNAQRFSDACLTLAVLTILTLLTIGIANYTSVAADSACIHWNLEAEFRYDETGPTANPNPDSCGNGQAWRFLMAPSRTHDPASYLALTGRRTGEYGNSVLPSWYAAPASRPSIGFNRSDQQQIVAGTTVWPAKTIGVHAGPGQLAVIAWRSPIAGVVSVAGKVRKLDTSCGDGASWALDLGATTLASGEAPGDSWAYFGGAQTPLHTLTMSQGESLYLIIDPKSSNHGCDYVGVQLVITPVAALPTPPNQPCSVWDLGADFRTDTERANPSPDRCGQLGVWHYLTATSRSHAPTTYTRILTYQQEDNRVAGLEGWWDGVRRPSVGKNISEEAKTIGSQTWPAGSLMVHAGPGKLAVVGWQSPVTGSVSVSGEVYDQDSSCGDGAAWAIDSGPATLASGALPNGARQALDTGATGTPLRSIAITQGQFLYLIIDPASDNHSCDAIGVVLRITMVNGQTNSLYNCNPSTPWTMFAGLGTNVVCGNFVHQQADLAIPGRGAALNLTRTYNSAETTDIGFGPGWSYTYGMSVTAESGGTLLVRQADGRRDRYTPAAGGTYTPPAGIYDTLVRNADSSYTLTTPAQFAHRFDAAGRLASIADRNGTTTTLTWATGGLTVTESGGRTFTLAYDPDGQHFALLTDSSLSPARTIGYDYGPTTKELTSVRDVRGGTSQMAYTGGRLQALIDQLGRTVIANTYDPATGKVSEQWDANTVAAEAVVGSRQPFVFDYSVPGQTRVTDRRGNATTYQYDASFRVVGVRDAKDLSVSFTWDGRNDLRCAIDRKGNRTGYSYDDRGNVQRIVPAENAAADCTPIAADKVFEYIYTARNDVATATAPSVPLGGGAYRRLISYGYDGNGNLLTITMPLGHSLTYDPNPVNGDVRSVTDQNGFSVFYEYDQFGHQTSFTDPSIPVGSGIERRTRFVVDAAGRITQRIDPLGNSVSYEYTTANHLRETRTISDRAIGRTIIATATYDLAGQLTDTQDGSGSVTHTVYDPNGSPKEVYIAFGTAAQARTAYQRDASGNVRVRTDPDNLNTTYTYDELDLLTAMVAPQPTPAQPIRTTTEYGYDPNGNRTRLVDPNGLTTRFGYDQRDRLTRIDYPAKGSAAAFGVTYEYDALDQRRIMREDRAGAVTDTTSYAYDALGRLTGVAGGFVGVMYGYDLADPACTIGKATKLTYPNGFIATSCYDQAYRLTRVRDWNNKDVNYTYDNGGRLRTIGYPNNTKATYTYDDANRLTGVTHERLIAAALSDRPFPTPQPIPGGPGGIADVDPGGITSQDGRFPLYGMAEGPFFRQTLTLDDAGNRRVIAEPLSLDKSRTLDYDPQHRLTRVTYSSGGTVAYNYSPNGHRESATYGMTVRPNGYDDAKRLTSAFVKGVSQTYLYDANGNQTRRTVGSTPDLFAYDAANRLVSATVTAYGQTTDTTYQYDGDGLRVAEITAGVLVRLIWDVNRDLPVVLDDGAYLYLYGLGDAPIARLPKSVLNTARYYHRDGLGSTRVATIETGAADLFCDYDAFGAALDPDAECAESSAYAGERRDAPTGLYHLRARQYDPQTGRFTQPDPLGHAGGGNLYAYAGNNPATYTDPSGLSSGDPIDDLEQASGSQGLLSDKIRSAQAAQARLGNTGQGKPTFATIEDGSIVTRSGWKVRQGLASGYSAVRGLASRMGFRFNSAGLRDRGVTGRYHASHAEAQLAALAPNRPIGVSNAMCGECQRFFTRVAQYRGEVQVVADPQGIHIFWPDQYLYIPWP